MRIFGGIGRAGRSYAKRAFARARHPFVLDCEGNAECAACGERIGEVIHQEPWAYTRAQTEAYFCEPA